MKNTLLASVACLGLTCTVLTPPVAAQASIERLAPESTILIVGSKNFQTMMDHMQNTSLWSLWQSDQMKTMREDMVKQFGEDLDKMFEELGVEKDSLVHPSGAVGMALFTVRDDEGMPQPAFLMLADYGDEEKANKTDALVHAALKRGEDEGDIELDSKEINGRTVHMIDLSKMQEKRRAAEEGEEDFEFNPMPMPSPQDMVEGMTKLHYVRDGNMLLLSGDMDSLSDAIDKLADKDAASKFIERPDYQTIMSKLGDTDMYAVLLTRDIMDLMAANDPMGMSQMMRQSIRAMFGQVDGYGMGLRLDGATAMMEQTVFVSMPKGKAGLTTLIDRPAPRAAVPSFVGPEAVSYTSFTFKFSGLMDVIRNVVMANPMMAGQAGPQLDLIAPTVNQITATLGTQVHYATVATRPFTSANRHSVMAIECTNPQEFETVLTNLAAQGGLDLAPRDFLGQRIFKLDTSVLMMMMPMPMEAEEMSLGIGGGFLLIGATPSVEQSLRATSGGAGAATLATAAEFQRAAATLGNSPVIGWGYSDTVDAMESQIAAQREMIEKMIEGMKSDAEEWGEQGEGMDDFVAEYEKSLRESMKMWDSIDFNLLRRHLGSSAWQVQSTEDGMLMRGFLLNASKQ